PQGIFLTGDRFRETASATTQSPQSRVISWPPEVGSVGHSRRPRREPQVVGYIKGKSAIHLARVYGELKRGFIGQHFWARGYFVSTVGRDEKVIRDYIKNQEKEDQRLDQLNLWR